MIVNEANGWKLLMMNSTFWV